MIEFTTWLRQILRYCEFIAMDGAVRSAWIDHDYSHTSITDFDELYEQLFDDLDSDLFLEGLPNLLPDVHCQRAIREFLLAIKAVDIELRSVLDKKRLSGSICISAVEHRNILSANGSHSIS